jgi:putative hydrolase of the HAD superfamily
MLEHGFQVFALSYELGACKPARKIFDGAAKLAGVAPSEIFFVDDVTENVTAAREAGFDAVLYTTTRQLASDLRARGLEFNY